LDCSHPPLRTARAGASIQSSNPSRSARASNPKQYPPRIFHTIQSLYFFQFVKEQPTHP
jgi:hypothetical protein